MFNTILVEPLFNLLALIYAYLPLHDFGLAIIILTVIVRIVLWPLVNKQLHNQRAMQELQPELQRIRTECKGDKQLEGKLIMELYKEKEINPFASFLPVLLQLPIFFALFVVLRDVVDPGKIAHLAYDPIKHLAPIADIIKGASFHPTFLGLINLAKPAIVLAVIAGLAQFVQTKQLTPKQQPNGDSQAQIMKGMTYLFPVLTLMAGLALPGALALYWIVTSLVAILQQWLVLRQDVSELETGLDKIEAKVETGSKISKTKAKAIAKAKGGKA